MARMGIGEGMSVEFPYWGEHQIWDRLSREEHRGRYFFWFNREFFSRSGSLIWLMSPLPTQTHPNFTSGFL